MDPTLTLLLLLAFAFAAVRVEQALFGEGITFIASGEALVLGAISGPMVLGVLDADGLTALEPLLSVISGFIGFLVGLPLRLRGRAKLPMRDVAFGLTTMLGITLCVGGGAFAVLAGLPTFSELDPGQLHPIDILIAAGTLGFGAAVCGAEGVQRAVLHMRSAGPVSRILPRGAALTQVLAILGFGVLIASTRASDRFGSTELDAWAWSSINIAAGLASGVIFHVFVGAQATRDQLFVATIGLVCLASGIAHALHFSPLFLGLVAGATVANLSPCAPRLHAAVERLQHPIYTLLLLMAGAQWKPLSALYWLFPIGFVALRVLAVRASAGLAAWQHPELDRHTRGLGRALLGQGPLAAAIAVNYGMVAMSESSSDEMSPVVSIVTTCLLISAVLNEFWAAPLARKMLQEAGETERTAPAKPAAPGSNPNPSGPNPDTTPTHEVHG